MKKLLLAFGLTSVLAAPLATATSPTPPSAQTKPSDLAPEVSLDELKKIVNNKSALIIDANGTKVYEEGHIPGAISFAKHEGKLAAILPKDKNALIIAYCGGPLCLAWQDAAKEAKSNGYHNLQHYKGGIKAWKEAKLPLESGPSKT